MTAGKVLEGSKADVLGVFVGQPTIIGELRGRPVESGIVKTSVDAPELALGLTNLDGDKQADLTVHGGVDKAVYAYPSEHYRAWRADGFGFVPGQVGENISLAGLTEREVRVGDRWRWGSALVEVTQPRAPCFKFAMRVGRKDAGPRMIETRRTGWYLRVLEEGTVPTAGAMVLDHRDEAAPSIHEAFVALFGLRAGEGDTDVLAGIDTSPEGMRRLVAWVLAAPALAEDWRVPIESRQGNGRS